MPTLIGGIIHDYVKQKWYYLAAYGVLSVFGLLLSLGIPYYVEKFFANILSTGTNPTGMSLRFIVMVILACWFFGELSYFLQALVDRFFIPELRIFTNVRLVRAIMDRYGKDYRTLDSTEILTKIVKLPFVLGDLVVTVRTSCLSTLYIMLGAIVYMFVMVGYVEGMATLSFCVLALGSVIAGFITTLGTSTALDKAYDDTYDHYSDILDNILSVFAFGAERKEEKAAVELHKQVLKSLRQTFWRITASRTAAVSLIGVYIVTIMTLLYRRSQSGAGTSGIGAAAMVALFLTGHFNGFLSNMWSLAYDSSVLQRLDKYMTELVSSTSDTLDMQINLPDNREWALQLEGGPNNEPFQFRYNENKVLALRVDDPQTFKFTPKDATRIYQIKGPTGSGKSTLLHLLSGRLRPTVGRVLLGGLDVTTLSTRALSDVILYVPQVPMLFQRTVFENIDYPRGSVTSRAAAEEKLREFGLDRIAANLDMTVEKFGSNVSGGQRQLIYLARVVLTSKANHKVILLDEPFSSVDACRLSEGLGRQLLRDLTQEPNRVVIYVSHVEVNGRDAACCAAAGACNEDDDIEVSSKEVVSPDPPDAD